jgi:hypothetical protein
MLDPENPVLHRALRQWFFRQRIEESKLMRSALETTENESSLQTFRNPAWNNQLDEFQAISQGMPEMLSPGPEKDQLAWHRSALDEPRLDDLTIARASLEEQRARLRKLADEVVHLPPDLDSARQPT